MKVSKFTVIKRTIGRLQDAYPLQIIDRGTVVKCLNDKEFQAKYVNY